MLQKCALQGHVSGISRWKMRNPPCGSTRNFGAPIPSFNNPPCARTVFFGKRILFPFFIFLRAHAPNFFGKGYLFRRADPRTQKGYCGRGTNYCTIWLKNTPKLRQNCTQKTRHRRRTKLAAALRAAANFGRRGCRVFCVQFWRNFGVMFNQIVQ